mgnify:CR=1 FL=1
MAFRLSHAKRVIFPHNDVSALTRLFEQHRAGGHTHFIVTESLFSMEGDQPPLADYAALCESTGATLIVDEAHAVGLYVAPRGSGLIEAAGIGSNAMISVNTAGKALGVSGAFVAGPSWAIDYLIQRARPFIFSTAPLPAIASAIEASLTIVAAEPWRREKLSHLSRRLRLGLARAGVAVSPGESQSHSDRFGWERSSGRSRRSASGPRFRRPCHSDHPACHQAPRAFESHPTPAWRKLRSISSLPPWPESSKDPHGAPRSLRNRNRHWDRQDHRLCRAPAALPGGCAASILEAHSNRHRARR